MRAQGRRILTLRDSGLDEDAGAEDVGQVAVAGNWPTGGFDAAHAAVIERRYMNEWTWPRETWSPSKEYKSILHCVLEVDSFEGILAIYDRSGQLLRRKTVVKTNPDEFSFARMLPEGASLRVIGPEGYDATFTGVTRATAGTN